MIEYVEARNADFEVIGILDTAQSVIWHSVYYGVGDYEIYIDLQDALSVLADVRYITRPNNREVGVIESVLITDDIESGKMITFKGRFAKSLLDRRLIYNLSGTTNIATVLRGNVEQNVRNLVRSNAIASRSLGVLELGAVAGISKIIVDENGAAAQKQVSYANLLDYTEEVLKEYGIASTVILNGRKLQYIIYEGADRSADNTDGNQPIVFSKEFDNLLSSEYSHDSTREKNFALIGGEGEGAERFYALLSCQAQGLQRREMWIDAKSTKKTVKASEALEMFPTGVFEGTTFNVGGAVYANLVHDDPTREYTLKSLQETFPSGTTSGTKFIVSGATYANRVYGDDETYTLTDIGYKATLDAEEKEGDYTLTDSVYTSLLTTIGKQTLASLVVIEEFDGTIDITNGNWRYGEHVFLGDIVTVQDNDIGVYKNVRLAEVTEYQDQDGYTVEAVYQGE